MTDDPLREFKGCWLAMWLGLVMWVVIGFLAKPSYAGYAKYRIDHCEVAGCTNLNLEACHILPQVDYPELANTESNICTLCRGHHVALSHYGNTTRYYNIRLRETIEELNKGKREYKKYENTTDKPQ